MGNLSASEETLTMAFAAIGLLALVLLVVVFLLWLKLKKQNQPQGQPSTEAKSAVKSDPSAAQDLNKYQGFLEDNLEGALHAVKSNPFRIGRHSTNHLTIVDRSVSRQHAEIHRNPRGAYTIIDMDSMNGVFVNNRQLRRSVLNDGDLVELGDVSFTFRLVEANAQPPTDTIRAERSEAKLKFDDELDFEPDIFNDLDDDFDDLGIFDNHKKP